MDGVYLPARPAVADAPACFDLPLGNPGEQWRLYGPPIEVRANHESDGGSARLPEIDINALAPSFSQDHAEALNNSKTEYLIRRKRAFVFRMLRERILGPELFSAIREFRGLHYPLAYWAQRSPAFRQLLLQTNPTLAFALAAVASPLDPSFTPELLQSLASIRQRTLAERLGFPAASWRILARVTPSALSLERLEVLRQRLHDPGVFKLAQHLPRLGEDTVEILASPQLLKMVSSRFLARVEEYDLYECGNLLRKLSAILQLIGETRRYDTPEALLAEERWLVNAPGAGADWVDAIGYARFAAPLPNEPGCIEAIDTGTELIREAWQQNNCVASPFMIQRLLASKGKAALYRVLPRWGLERATLMIERLRTRRSRWVLTEIAAANNYTVRRSTERACLIWLADAQRVRDFRSLRQPKPEP